ncbi:hypothetical protein QA634_05930 [Methylobacterium sp. CB376]|uniref:hypothetical protein n=1 Tax=unclassified Methylobacterium TaxID=2615210 RepID=UPI002240C608|nr:MULTISPECIES: hypothetical protein [Methylobacterium]WFT81379.1 hypothetical protein QA634_05670 [Methylobacterium nodulans]WFT81427.1 hypothetical protein QA634_05930 [Methylobacterium nodulans]
MAFTRDHFLQQPLAEAAFRRHPVQPQMASNDAAFLKSSMTEGVVAGDMDFQESVVFHAVRGPDAQPHLSPQGRALPVLQQYGRIAITLGDVGVTSPINEENLYETERLGLDAFRLRSEQSYRKAKANRPANALTWGGDGPRAPLDKGDLERSFDPPPGAPAAYRLIGRVAAGLVIVSGPGALAFTQAERTKIVAEVQNAHAWLSSQSPAKDVTFVPIINQVDVTAADNPQGGSYESQEQFWRDEALSQLGHDAGTAGIAQFLQSMRQSVAADYYYCAFFVKYTTFHFAYAHPESAYLVLNYYNDSWGADNIDRVFARESCHIFGAPDEYALARCECGGSWGVFGRPNINCESCAPSGGEPCLMKANTWSMCAMTPYHVGYNGLPAV